MPDMSGNFSTSTWAGDFSLLFARTWAERLQAQLPVVRAASAKLHRINRQIERMEDWSPSESDYEEAFRALWAECVLTVWIADGLHRWLTLLSKELGEESPPEIPELRNLRNALIHLDEASFDRNGPHAGDGRGNRSLRELPGERIFVQSWSPGSPLFELIDVEALERMSSGLLNRLGWELNRMAEDYLVQEEIDRRRGK
jgi:hypothetical protein